MNTKQHWQNVYQSKASDQVSWFQAHAALSLTLVNAVTSNTNAHILDVGGGASVFVDDLLNAGYTNLSVLDISSSALAISKRRLGAKAQQVRWLVDDVTQLQLPTHSVDVWHDRAVFHFLTLPEQRQRYIEAVLNGLKPGGFLVIATFALSGPEKCSGIEVQRYDADSLNHEFGAAFELVTAQYERHQTPFQTEQDFVFCCFRRQQDENSA